jgi:hypothetical protein
MPMLDVLVAHGANVDLAVLGAVQLDDVQFVQYLLKEKGTCGQFLLAPN